MRPVKMTPAHKSEKFGELVCSNSLRSDSLENACGILKVEMEMHDSIVIKTARETAVPAGGALAVDREGFSLKLTNYIKFKNYPTHRLKIGINHEVYTICD